MDKTTKNVNSYLIQHKKTSTPHIYKHTDFHNSNDPINWFYEKELNNAVTSNEHGASLGVLKINKDFNLNRSAAKLSLPEICININYISNSLACQQ